MTIIILLHLAPIRNKNNLLPLLADPEGHLQRRRCAPLAWRAPLRGVEYRGLMRTDSSNSADSHVRRMDSYGKQVEDKLIQCCSWCQ
eukprot:1176529-Prorocentrum_minimum.AAC.2